MVGALEVRMEAPLTDGPAKQGLPQRRGPGIPEALCAVAALIGFEMALSSLLPSTEPGLTAGTLLRLTGVRLAEIALLYLYWRLRGWTPADLGLTGAKAAAGLRWGIAISLGFGLAAGLLELGSLAFGKSFLALISGTKRTASLPILFVAGAVVGPFVEELVFRGLVYGALRKRLSTAPAVLLVTAFFALAHTAQSGGGYIPWIEAVGGVAFCLVYEKSRSLWAPYLVHALGNAALFTLPYLR